MMVGVYKIESPSGRIYIGQSTDIDKRFSYYKKLKCKTQAKLYRSLLKYGVESHSFEVIWLCSQYELNYFERKFQLKYNSVESGLNLRLTADEERSGYMSDETKLKMKNSSLNKVPPSRKGKKHTAESKMKMSLIQKKLNKDGRMYSEDSRFFSKERRLKMSISKRKKVIDTTTGFIYESVKELSELIKVKHGTLISWLNGNRGNKTSYRYLNSIPSIPDFEFEEGQG